jgi:hypothetical protein
MNPGTPFSLLLVAAGAILVWGVEDRVEGVDLAAVGVILLAVGAIGLALSLAFWSAIFGRPTTVAPTHTHGEVYHEPPQTTYVTRERVVQPPYAERHDTGEVLDYREERHTYRR